MIDLFQLIMMQGQVDAIIKLIYMCYNAYILYQELMSRRRRRRSMKLEFHVNPNYVTEFEINLIRHAQVM